MAGNSTNNSPHGHTHAHAHIGRDGSDARIGWAVAVNLGLTLVQIVGGLLSGSLALIADALHNFSDAVALIVAFGGRRIARRPANAAMSFGYGRAEVIAALVNYTTLIVLALVSLFTGFRVRFFPFKLCPFIFTLSAALIGWGAWI